MVLVVIIYVNGIWTNLDSRSVYAFEARCCDRFEVHMGRVDFCTTPASPLISGLRSTSR